MATCATTAGEAGYAGSFGLLRGFSA